MEEKCKELQNILDEMIKRLEEGGSSMMFTPVNHYDYLTLLYLIKKILRIKNEA